jgi:succinate-acetate transporter protein
VPTASSGGTSCLAYAGFLFSTGLILRFYAPASIDAAGNNGFDAFGGWVLIIDGIVAWYLSWALTVNPLIGDKLPLWPYPYTWVEPKPEAGAGITPTPAG